MLCQNCNKREANVHITKIINGVKTEMHLCDECARKQEEKGEMPFSLGMPLSFQNILEGFFELPGVSEHRVEKVTSCPICGMTFEDFRRKGFLGCGKCYEVFNEDMKPLIRRIHGNIHHTGKIPVRTGGTLRAKTELEKLKEELKAKVAKEEYEDAAQIRDKIKEIEQKLNDEKKEN